jgi:hypothetical protein
MEEWTLRPRAAVSALIINDGQVNDGSPDRIYPAIDRLPRYPLCPRAAGYFPQLHIRAFVSVCRRNTGVDIDQNYPRYQDETKARNLLTIPHRAEESTASAGQR